MKSRHSDLYRHYKSTLWERDGALVLNNVTRHATSHCQVFVSKDVARHFGFNSAPCALKGLYSRVRKG